MADVAALHTAQAHGHPRLRPNAAGQLVQLRCVRSPPFSLSCSRRLRRYGTLLSELLAGPHPEPPKVCVHVLNHTTPLSPPSSPRATPPRARRSAHSARAAPALAWQAAGDAAPPSLAPAPACATNTTETLWAHVLPAAPAPPQIRRVPLLALPRRGGRGGSPAGGAGHGELLAEEAWYIYMYIYIYMYMYICICV